MANGSALTLLLAIEASWCLGDDARVKRAKTRSQISVSDRRSSLTRPVTDAIIKFRDKTGRPRLDLDARLLVSDNGKVYLQSANFVKDLLSRDLRDQILFIFTEQVDDVLRMTICVNNKAYLNLLSEDRPELRLNSYDLPPVSVTEIGPSYSKDGMPPNGIYEALLSATQRDDAALFSVHTDSFLRAPHIIVPLLSHLAGLSAEDNLKFPIQIKRLADQFRTILETDGCPIRINKVERNHLETWADAQGKKFGYLDGGIAKIAGLPGTEPTAMRVGIYSVIPGEEQLDEREGWALQPFVVGDIIDKNTGVHMDDNDQIDFRRLGEAVRYTLEPLTGLRFIETTKDVNAIFSHGPLINQFAMYDEAEPNYIPFLKREFLSDAGIEQSDIEGRVNEIPRGRNGERMWRQFMSVYGYVTRCIFELDVPFIGVVERGAGNWLSGAVLEQAVTSRIVPEAYKRKVTNIIKRYGISDDFLFGCILEEGEYITPVTIRKNEVRRAHEHWKPVIRQYPNPHATILKTSEFSFPFRVEMNSAGFTQEQSMLRLLYHTARLLPRYAFPVGLDIVDKYAKVPEWLSGNISARLAATVLNRAMAEGDARLIAQVRRLLSHTPRDFFYRPKP